MNTDSQELGNGVGDLPHEKKGDKSLIRSPAKPAHPTILDIDFESTSAGPSTEALIEKQRAALLAEEENERRLTGPSQEEVTAEAIAKALQDEKEAENKRALAEGIAEIVEPRENLFERKAMELHISGKPKRRGLGLLGRKYQVEELIVDQDGKTTYPSKLTYRIEGKGANKRYIPESYTQGLALGATDVSRSPQLVIQLEDGKIKEISMSKRQWLPKESNQVSELGKTQVLKDFLPHAIGDVPMELSFALDHKTGEISMEHAGTYNFDPQNNVFNSNNPYYRGQPEGTLSSTKVLQLMKDVVGLIPTRDIN